MKVSRIPFRLEVLALFLFLVGCNLPLAKTEIPPASPTTKIIPTILPESTPTPGQTVVSPTATDTAIPEVIHKTVPGSPIGRILQTVWDQVDENTAPQKQAFGGDDFRNGKYERPFDQSMNYLPLADLVSVQLSREDPLWVYIYFKVDQPFSVDPSASPYFAVEIDSDLDSRGNVLIITGTPKSNEWSTESVRILTDPDFNVGGITVVKPDGTLSEGRGYYTEVFNNGSGEDPDLAWSRLSKTDPSTVLIAFKNTLTGGEKGKFIWLPWTNISMLDWSLFEFNDHFTFSQAGFPLKEDAQNYPLKALWGVDNTCRVPSGFTPDGTMPGLCPKSEAPEPEEPSGSSRIPFCRRPCMSRPGCCD